MATSGEHPVEGVTELVQEGAHLPWCEQSWAVGRGLGEVHHQHDVRAMVLAFGRVVLLLQVVHPRTALLPFAWEEVGIE